MLIIPAIDLLNGECVRLKQGQYDQVTQFAITPVDKATDYAKKGTKRLHLVDLNGAQSGTMQHLTLIKELSTLGMSIQAGGGIRSLESARQAKAAGIDYLVLGSIAVTNRELCTQIINAIGAESIVLALDVRIHNGTPIPATHGWQNLSTDNLWDLTDYYQIQGIKQILCTDIACDGMMSGPNLPLYKEAVRRFPQIDWQASGGIRNEQDIAELDSIGVAAAILGLTLYQNNFDLSACLREYASC